MDSAFSAAKIDVTRSIKRSKNKNQLALNYTKAIPLPVKTPLALRIDIKNGE
jgi:hypothetical protein